MENEIVKPETPASSPARRVRSRIKIPKRAVIYAVAGLAAVALVVCLIVFLTNRSSNSGPVDTDWNAQEDKSGSNYVAFQKKIINNKNASSAQVFDAQIALASYYTAVGDYSSAEKILKSIKLNEASVERSYRVYNMFARLYEANGDTTNAEKYAALREEYRSKLDGGSVPVSVEESAESTESE